MSVAVSLHLTSRRASRARIAFALLLALFSVGQAMAAPLADYKARVVQALEKLTELVEEQEYSSAGEHAALVEQLVNDVRQTLPPDEMVQWEGGGVRVNHSWLLDELKIYQRMPPEDWRREELLAGIIQRLRAHADRLIELETEESRRVVFSKEEERKRLESILRREEFGEQPPEKNIFVRMWERIKNWWDNLFPRGGSLQPGQTTWLSFIAMLVVFALAAAVVTYVVWKLMPYLRRWKSSGLNLEKRGARIVLGEHLAADKTAADLLDEAEALARQGELRAAIRKGYIALLCELGDRKVITLAQHKTNHDYLRAVREKRPLLNEMQKLTNSFENHWYGFRPVTKNDWTSFRTGYQQTLKTASLLSDK
jgi:hypothetical protein